MWLVLILRLLDKHKQRKSSKLVTQIKDEGVQLNSPGEISNAFWKRYANMFIQSQNSNYDDVFKAEIGNTSNLEVVDHDMLTPEYKILNSEISLNEIKDAYKTLKLGKAPGHDGNVNEHLKYTGDVVFQYLNILYNCYT